MARKGFKRNFPPLEILRKEDVEQIKMASLDILKETGMTIEHKTALELLQKNGCLVDFDTMRVRFPEGLVKECLSRCPSSYRVKTRDEKDDLIFGGNTVYFHAAPGMGIVDLDSWSYREPTEREFIESVTVLDALEYNDYYSVYTPYFGYSGVPEVMKMTMGLVQLIKHSTKLPGAGFANYNWDFNFRIAKAAGTEVMCPALMVSSPLALSEFAVEAAYKTLEYGFPCGVDTGSVFGSTSPATLAGSLAEFNAELLGCIVLIQLIKPYSRVFVYGFPHSQNMRNGAPNFGNISNVMFNAANNQIWRDYGVPVRNTASCYTSSKKIDFQNGMERSMAATISALSGASAINLHGGIYGELTHHPVQAILDNDMAGMIGRFIQGIDVNDETLALDLIHMVGPVPGHFLDKEHTFNWWQHEQHIEECADTMTYPEWEREGKMDCIDYAKEKMKKILSNHEVSKKLSVEQEEEINEIIREEEEFYKKRGELN